MTIWGRSADDDGGGIEGCGTLPFSEALFPLVRHPLVGAVGPRAKTWLLSQRLYGYLDWTFALETDVVLHVAGRLADDHYALDAGQPLTDDALKIIWDEGFHSLEAMGAKHAAMRATGIAPSLPFFQPSFMTSLRTAEHLAGPSDRQIVRLVFAMVSETLITGFLTDLPKDENVLPIVRETVRRHAVDEASHHRVFAKVMTIAWDRWNERQRDHYAPWFAEFLDAFLAPDKNSSTLWLRQLGLTEEDAQAVLEDVYAPSKQAPQIRSASEPSLRAMRRAGLFERQSFVDALGARGLI